MRLQDLEPRPTKAIKRFFMGLTALMILAMLLRAYTKEAKKVSSTSSSTPSATGGTATPARPTRTAWKPPANTNEWLERKMRGEFTAKDREWEKSLPVRNLTAPHEIEWPAARLTSTHGRYTYEVARVPVTIRGAGDWVAFRLPVDVVGMFAQGEWKILGSGDWTVRLVEQGDRTHFGGERFRYQGRLLWIRNHKDSELTITFELRRKVKVRS